MFQTIVYLTLLYLFLVICLSFSYVSADQKFYRDSNAAFVSTSNINLNRYPYVAHMNITVHINRDAGSHSPLYATLIGDFASSGPHALPVLLSYPGRAYPFDLTLSREIGQLKSIWVENQSSDSLKLSQWVLRLENIDYVIDIPDIWIQKYSPTTPKSDIHAGSTSTLLLNVKEYHETLYRGR